MTKQQYQGIAIGSVMTIFFIIFDLTQPLGVAGGIPYILPVLVGFFVRERFLIILFGFLGITLTIVGFYMSPLGSDSPIVLMNCGLAVFFLIAVMVTGYLMVGKQLALENKLRTVANIDALTGVNTRRVLMEEIEKRVSEAHRYNLSLSVILIDIDYFKKINDRYGHQKGDRALKLVSQKCKEMIRKSDLLGRYGGEEFLVICPNTLLSGAMTLAERMRALIEELSTDEIGVYESLSISIGVTSLVGKEMSAEQLIYCVDSALYSAKRGGRNQVVFYEEEKHKKTLVSEG